MITLTKKQAKQGYEVPATKCPSCGEGTLIVRKNHSNGRKFLGCTEYPVCHHGEEFILESENQLKLFKEGEK